MNTIKISETKLKLILTPKDCERYNIKSSEFDCADGEARVSLKKLLNSVKAETGIDPDCGRMLIQLYPDREGGCEIFVTLLDDKTEPHIYHNTEAGGYMPKADGRNDTAVYRKASDIYEFGELSLLLSLCGRLISNGKKLRGVKSAAYFDEERKSYFIVFFDLDICGEIFSEYGGVRRHSDSIYYIKEHCREICENNAVEVLGALC